MKLALKIDVDTFRGTRVGVPRLVEVLKKYGAGATFLFSLGPDNTGRAIKRAFRPGFMKKVSRTSVLEHYGIITLMYGTVIPAPDIGKRCAPILRTVRDAGFEVGIHCNNHYRWQDYVHTMSAAAVEAEFSAARAEFRQLATADAIWDSLLRFTSAPGLVEPKFPPAQAPTRHAPGEPAATPYSSKAITRVNPYRTLNHES